MSHRNLYSKDPERVLEQDQLLDLKHRLGCAACVKRSLLAMAIGGLACGIPGNYPKPKFCEHWEHDEGVKSGNNSEAA